MKKLNKIFSGFLVLAMLLSPSTGFAGTTNFDSVTIGSASDTQTLTLNGTAYTSLSLGSDGNFSSAAGVLTADLAPTKFIFTASSGDLSVTGATIGTGDVTFANGGKIDGDTANEIRLIENSDTLKIGFSGDDITVDTTDGGVIFGLTDATDGKVYFKTNNDTDDYMIVSTASNVPTISTAGTSNLIIAPDGGDTQITGTLAVSGVATAAGVTTSSTITLQNSETIVNSTNNTVTVGGGTNTILNVLDVGTSDSDATLSLSADAAADNGDVWRLNSDGTTNSMLFENNTSGSQATILTLANTGLVTTTGDVTVAGTTPLVTIGDGGDEDAGIQINSDTNDFYIASENTLDDFMIGNGSAIGTTPILTMTDAGVATHTGSTDGDLTVYGAGTTASDAYLRLVGDAGADASDRWQLFNDSSAGTLYFQSDISVAGTYVTLASIDANGDWVFSGTTPRLTVGDAGAEDASVVFDGHSGGFDWHITNDDSADDLVIGRGSAPDTTNYMVFDGAAEKITLGAGTGDVDTQFTFDGTAIDFSIGVDDSGDTFSLSVGTALGTTETFKTDGTTMTVTDALAVDGVFTTTGTGATLGNAIGDITTFTGKVAGATPMSFDGATADTVYTIFAMDDPASSSKTITFPAVTGQVMLGSASTALTAGAAVTLTVGDGNQTFTDTITTDNEDQTITFSGAGSAGDRITIIFTTDSGGSGDEVITFHTTLTQSAGTLTLANLTAGQYVVSFISNGSVWIETSRTAALS